MSKFVRYAKTEDGREEAGWVGRGREGAGCQEDEDNTWETRGPVDGPKVRFGRKEVGGGGVRNVPDQKIMVQKEKELTEGVKYFL